MKDSKVKIGHLGTELCKSGLAAMMNGSIFTLENDHWRTESKDLKDLLKECDIVVIEAEIEEFSGVTVAARALTENSSLKIIVLADIIHPKWYSLAMAMGCRAYITKDIPQEELLAILDTVAADQGAFDTKITRQVGTAMGTRRSDLSKEVPLTQREEQVIRGIAAGKTNKEIAQDLDISYETVKEHVQHILRKVGVSDRTQAAVWATRKGLIPKEDTSEKPPATKAAC